MAAAQAIEAVAGSVAQWSPQGGTVDTVRTTEALSFGSVQLSQVLAHGAPLLASGGKEFDAPDESLDTNARLALQRTQLRQRLGLGAEVDALISDEDVQIAVVNADERSRRQREEEEAQRKAAEVRAVLASSEGLSARERNKARRKLKQAVDMKASTSLRTSTADVSGTAGGAVGGTGGVAGNESKIDEAQAFAQAEPDEWPFSPICERLRHELFDSQWEVRHGAALALRDVLRLHGRGAGTSAELSHAANAAANAAWLEDCAVRCVCVLALDRFADYVGDTAVAPVRETTAQALAALAKHLAVPVLHQLVRALLELAGQPRWETRHGALQGLKYLVAVRGADLALVHAAVVAALQAALSDAADDVRAVAADALLPLAGDCTASATAAMAMPLWDALTDLDELTAATASVLTLLAELHALGTHVPAPLVDLMPRLWPFFYHPVQSVRAAAFRMTQSLLSSTEKHSPISAPTSPSPSPSSGLSVAILVPALRHTFQTGRYESAVSLATHIQSLWWCLLSQSVCTDLSAVCGPLLSLWVELAATPLTHPLAAGLLLQAHHHGQGHAQQLHTPPAPEPVASADGRKRGRGASASDATKKARGDSAPTHTHASAPSAVPSSAAVALDLVPDEELRRASLLASLLGALYPLLPAASLPSALEPVFQLLNSMSARKRLLGALICHEAASSTGTSSSALRTHLAPVLTRVLVIDDELALGYADVDAPLAQLVSDTRALAVASARLLSAGQLAAFTQPLEKPTAQARVAATRALLAALAGLAPAALPPETSAKRAAVQHALERTEAVAQATHVQVQAAAAAALAACGSLPEKINPVMRPLMSSLRIEALVPLQRRSARALAEVLRQLEGRQPAPHAKVLANVCALLCAPLAPLFTGVPLSEADAALAQVGQRGAEQALHQCAATYGAALFTALPSVWDACAAPLAPGATDPKACAEALLVLERLYCALHPSALATVREQLLQRVVASLRSASAPVRGAAARCLAAACGADEAAAMEAVVRHVLPMLGESTAQVRLGACEAVGQVVRVRGAALAPYLAFLAVPLMRRMADPVAELRTSVAATFAAIVRLLPLEAGAPEPALPADLAALRREERKFVEQLLDGAKLEAFVPCVAVKAELRAYQREGVSWLAFLNRFGLHGVLCDDMGLGKTLQTITMITSDHAIRRARFKETQRAEFAPLPTLVVCPPTLVPHWIYEIGKFAPDDFTATAYQGAPAERAAVRGAIGKYEVVVMSYEVLRKDVEVLAAQAWNYMVLDEGHVIKNAKTKLAQAVKRIQAEHRLVLSGTPVQNNVLELWSLFDFLMPGFLGSERDFNEAFSRPILASRDAKASARDIEAGTLALEALHRQVLPFLLRRRKEDVLHDLPPKIIQDQYADLSALQLRLYESFAKNTNVSAELDAAEAEEAAASKATQHVFQALQYLRKLCSHPALVYDPAIPMHVAALKEAGGELHSIQHAPKLLALRQLLHDSGIGTEESAQPLTDTGAAHRVLLFAQMQATLDLVENDLLKPLMPTGIVTRFGGLFFFLA